MVMLDDGNSSERKAIIAQLTVLLSQVGAQLMSAWSEIKAAPGTVKVEKKADRTPLTAADMQAHYSLVAGLERVLPGCPIISEEQECASFTERMQWSRCWIIDPLDGTNGFIRGSRHFSVNVALVEQGQVILGLIYAPSEATLYYAWQGYGAYMQRSAAEVVQLTAHAFNPQQVSLVVGEGSLRSATRLVRYARQQGWHVRGVGSALKLAYMACGRGDFYPRVGPIYEWDIAAGQCILEQIGGAVVDFSGQALRYNACPEMRLPPLLAVTDASALSHILKLTKEVYSDVS